ncbi:purine-nucleoside phosphorylase [Dictyobacter kobayashii]|uniref:Lipoprotein n=1 Tax=Dictyobacter kobayashii TaxID=2014872 RepID=A0A402AX36_9CHLR|nr:purine nucleoside permease [Dictyobacter kobayashii]GCE23692.1 lipoprotein [Dictyobacter kobayashii]
MVFSSYFKRFGLAAFGLALCLIALLATLGGVHAAPGPFQVKVLVITMFSSETQPWLAHESLPLDYKTTGAFSDMHCNSNGLCVTTTGEEKVNAAASMMAILRDPQFSFQNTYFMTAGIGGASPSTNTLGSAAWARWVVDWDQGHHLLPNTVTNTPYGYLQNNKAGTGVYHLNETLTNLAVSVTSKLQLQDSAQAQAARQKYPNQANQHPSVLACDTMAGDDYWAGQQLSNEAQYITGQLTNNQGKYCTTEQEDTAVAAVLQRTGHLDHYLNLRTASNFDQPAAGQTIQDLLATFPGSSIAFSNAYLVGSTMAHYLLTYNGA